MQLNNLSVTDLGEVIPSVAESPTYGDLKKILFIVHVSVFCVRGIAAVDHGPDC